MGCGCADARGQISQNPSGALCGLSWVDARCWHRCARTHTPSAMCMVPNQPQPCATLGPLYFVFVLRTNMVWLILGGFRGVPLMHRGARQIWCPKLSGKPWIRDIGIWAWEVVLSNPPRKSPLISALLLGRYFKGRNLGSQE